MYELVKVKEGIHDPELWGRLPLTRRQKCVKTSYPMYVLSRSELATEIRRLSWDTVLPPAMGVDGPPPVRVDARTQRARS